MRLNLDPQQIEEICWNADGLIPVIAQNVRDNQVLMLAYMSEPALRSTLETGEMHYWSRSRGKLWRKGESSGNVQQVRSLHLDCDRDTILARVEQVGNACHTGSYTCFSDRRFIAGIIAELESVFDDRLRHPKPESYVNRLLDDRDLLLKKIVEEATEVILAEADEDESALIEEVADLVFHLMVLLFSRGLSLDDVFKALERRRR
ncbi:MAG: bifunctional phosphoribosyl-AMP cyclohydrolase/phosphoribosyl-ATP diphosphatase HisIE [Candidatus Bipolaricaulia bacterium]